MLLLLLSPVVRQQRIRRAVQGGTRCKSAVFKLAPATAVSASLMLDMDVPSATSTCAMHVLPRMWTSTRWLYLRLAARLVRRLPARRRIRITWASCWKSWKDLILPFLVGALQSFADVVGVFGDLLSLRQLVYTLRPRICASSCALCH